MTFLVNLLEKLGGAQPMDTRGGFRSVALGLYWLLLLTLVLVFAGRYSKFVYVDF
jgi:hypothetical protein